MRDIGVLGGSSFDEPVTCDVRCPAHLIVRILPEVVEDLGEIKAYVWISLTECFYRD